MSNCSQRYLRLSMILMFMMMIFIASIMYLLLETKDILKDLHAIIDKLNKTLEIFNGISHKTVKSLRKQLLYLKDKFKISNKV